MAEKSAEVGSATSVLLLERDPDLEEGQLVTIQVKELPHESLEEVRNLWTQHGSPRVPVDLHHQMEQFLAKKNWTHRVFLGFRKKS